MNWISNFVRPKISSLWSKREVPENLWIKCKETGEVIFHKDLEDNDYVTPEAGFHMKMPAQARMASLFDDGKYETIATPEVNPDPLKFRDERRYSDRLKDAVAKTKLDDAVLVATGDLNGLEIVAAVQDFNFMGGSLGRAAGQAIITAMMTAVEKMCPFILFASSGGARMQEGIFSLMQMPRTTVALEELNKHKLPYIVVLTNPTTGGVTASYAMLGDVHIAEPEALIGFAGPRVIEQTIKQKLPEGFQRAEYLLDHGMIDMVVERKQLRSILANLTTILMNFPAQPMPQSSGQSEVISDKEDDVAAGNKAQEQTPPDPQQANGAVANDTEDDSDKEDVSDTENANDK